MRQSIVERAAGRLPLAAATIVLAVVVYVGIRLVTPLLASPGATLGQRIVVCGRDYARGATTVISTHAEIVARDGIEPLVVGPGGCTPGACTRQALGACYTVVYVRVAPDGFVAFELRGGP